MNIDQIRRLYNQQIRIGQEEPDYHREVTPFVVRHISLTKEGQGWVSHTCLDDGNADEQIAEQVAFFTSIRQDFEWKYYDYDTPPDLLKRLERYGFLIEEQESIMVLEVELAPASLLQTHPPGVVRVTNMDQVSDVIAVEEQVWGSDHAWIQPFMREYLEMYPDRLSAYVVYMDGKPVSCAWTRYHPGLQFAGLWGGATLAEYRQRGLYTALLAARLQEALQRDIHFLTVDASVMSRPILEKIGFRLIALSHPCQWMCDSGCDV